MDYRQLIVYDYHLPLKISSMCSDFTDAERTALARTLKKWQTEDKNKLNHFAHNYEVYSIFLFAGGFTAGIDENYFNPYILLTFITLALFGFLVGKNMVNSYSNSLEWAATRYIEDIRKNR